MEINLLKYSFQKPIVQARCNLGGNIPRKFRFKFIYIIFPGVSIRLQLGNWSEFYIGNKSDYSQNLKFYNIW